MGYILDSIKALFTKNTTNAASVSGARVPIMSADGTPIGNDSLANLASVLGVVAEVKANISGGTGVLFTFSALNPKHGMRLYRENSGIIYYQITYNGNAVGKWMKLSGILVDEDPFT